MVRTDDLLTCGRCYRHYRDAVDGESRDSGMCFRCFEYAFEEWEEKRRELLAERNEY